jgi:restriction system protein
MAEITRKRSGELLRKLFEILRQFPDGLAAGDALKKLSAAVTLSEYEAGVYDEGARRFDKIVRFATVGCVKAGWLLKHKGTWTLTEAGVQAYKTLADPEMFMKEVDHLYQQWKVGQQVAAEPEFPVDDTGVAAESLTTVTFEQAEEQAWAEIERSGSGKGPPTIP